MNSKTYVFSDSVLCLKVTVLNQSKHVKDKIQWCLETRYLGDLDRIDGEQMELEWKICTGFTTLGILEEIQKMMTESKCELEHFKGRIIFMSMYIATDWRKLGNRKVYSKCSQSY